MVTVGSVLGDLLELNGGWGKIIIWMFFKSDEVPASQLVDEVR